MATSTWTMPAKIYYAKNVEEAIDMAQRFKEAGTYDLFRGQTHCWPPHSSAGRIIADAEKVERNKTRVIGFHRWLEHTEQLRYLLEPEYRNDCMAIMQHYGLATHYIDFSTESAVAGFFSADNYSEPPAGNCCIYCLDSEDLTEYAESILTFRKGAILEHVKVDVHNLWRLQSQRGFFIHANYNWDIDYPMDRIEFPYTGYPAYPPKEVIYPPEKSPLEQLLDQYFSLEIAYFNQQAFEKMLHDAEAKGATISRLTAESFPDGLYAASFKPGFAHDPSWSKERSDEWKNYLLEDFDQTVGETVRFDLTGKLTPESLRQTLVHGIKNLLIAKPLIRKKSIWWALDGLPADIEAKKLLQDLTACWNGMRRLPYSHAEIAGAMGYLLLLMAHHMEHLSYQVQIDLIGELEDSEGRTLAFSNTDNSSSRSIASAELLLAAVRNDIGQWFADPGYFAKDELNKLLHTAYNPRYLFDFPQFKAVFGRYIIPAQFILKRDLIIYDCYHLHTFGMP
jgi:hypothetical protein